MMKTYIDENIYDTQIITYEPTYHLIIEWDIMAVYIFLDAMFSDGHMLPFWVWKQAWGRRWLQVVTDLHWRICGDIQLETSCVFTVDEDIK